MTRRHRSTIVAGAAALLTACAPAAVLGAPRNLVADHARVTPGCPGFATSSSSPEGLSFQYGTPNGACSIGTPWGTPVAHGAQGRITFSAPGGSKIAALRGMAFRVQGQGGALASAEVFFNDASGEYQVANWSNTIFDWRSQSFAPRHPDGARSAFFLMRSHAYFTPGPTNFRQLDLNTGMIDLWDEEAPTIGAVSVDGGDTWSRAPQRTVRMTIDDNLGAGGIGLARVQSGAAILHDDVSPKPGAKTYSIGLGALGDGEHVISSAVVNAGAGDLDAVWGPNRVVRLDRTAPTQPTVMAGIPSGWAREASARPEGATDAHSGVSTYEWRTSTDDGANWSDPVPADTFVAAEDGVFRVQARARDGVGLVSGWTLATRELKVDRTPPGIAASVSGGRFSGQVPVGASAADATSGVREVRFAYRTVGTGSWTGIGTRASAPYAANLDSTALADGQYELRATAVDHAGNEASDTIEFAVANRADPTGAGVVVVAPGAIAAGSTREGTTPPGPAGASRARALLLRARSVALNRRGVVTVSRNGVAGRAIARHPAPGTIRLAGRLVDARGGAVTRTVVDARLPRRRAVATTTDGAGRFLLRVPTTAAGAVTLRVDGRRVATWRFDVAPVVRTAAARTVRAGHRWRIAGRVHPSPRSQGIRRHIALLYGADTRRCPQLRSVVAGGRIFARPRPRAGRRIADRCWKLVASGHVEPTGRFSIGFAGFAPLTLRGRPYPGGYRYAAYFQVRIPATAGWRVGPARSVTRTIAVRG